MFQGATRGRSAAQATTWIEDVRPCWNMAETCLAVLAERGLTRARLGLAAMPRLVPHADWQTLAAGLAGATLVDAEDVVNRQRAIKSDRETAQLRRASEVVHRALDSVARPLQGREREADGHARQTSELSLAAAVMHEARTQGAEDIRFMVATPADTGWAFRPVEDRPFRDGETVTLFVAASWERYWAEATRTFVVDANRLSPGWTADLDRRFRARAGALTPGVKIADWTRAALDALTAAEASAIAPCGLGHGIGITPEEQPLLSIADPSTVQRGMCLAVRAAFQTERGVILHGDTIVV
jgi:Xaa-Pro aminopeptidase